jgi:type II secretory pathway pseudopilin PulG
MYQILKDFAGPVATIIASITAAYITWYFASRQAQIAQQQAITAKQQADTAFDQLRLNLFQKRFAIYNAARELIALVVNERNLQGSDLVPLQVVLNEAEFFFSPDICDWLRTVRKKCSDLLVLQSTQHLPGAPASEISARSTHLFDLLTEMPRRFESDLGFRHVRRGAPPS